MSCIVYCERAFRSSEEEGTNAGMQPSDWGGVGLGDPSHEANTWSAAFYKSLLYFWTRCSFACDTSSTERAWMVLFRGRLVSIIATRLLRAATC